MVCSANVLLSKTSTDTIPTFKFFSSFIAMLCATAPVSIIGTRFAMSVDPFWTPERFSERRYLLKINRDLTKFSVPVIGMLSGNSVSAIVVSIDYVLKEFV